MLIKPYNDYLASSIKPINNREDIDYGPTD